MHLFWHISEPAASDASTETPVHVKGPGSLAALIGKPMWYMVTRSTEAGGPAPALIKHLPFVFWGLFKKYIFY